jgi:hypothetical protein
MAGIQNRELLEKAVITTDALASAGKLNPGQSDKFIDYVIDETVLKNNARVVRFRNETLEIDKIGIGRRAALPKTEAQDPGLRRGISTSKIVLQPREIIVPFEVGDNFKEVALEENVEDHIIKMMATQLANDLEELYVNADLVGPATLESTYREGGDSSKYVKDKYLALQDGWFRLADGGHAYDAEGKNIGLSVFNAMLRQMPTKFRRNKAALRWFMSPDLAQIYFEKLSTRATALGDQAAGGAGHSPFGVPMVEVPLLDFLPPVVQHVTLPGTTAVALRYSPVSSVVVTPTTLETTPVTPYVDGADYDLVAASGTIARHAGGAITDGQTVKVTYGANPQILLTHQANFIVGIGRDIRIERDRDIYKGVNQYAITAKVAVQFEEADALVKGKNIGQGV